MEGKEITVEFDSPRALQIDGETVSDAPSHTAAIPKKATVKEPVMTAAR